MSLICDEMEEFIGVAVAVNLSTTTHAFFGTVVDLSEQYITLKKSDGRVIKLRRKEISAVEAMRDGDRH